MSFRITIEDNESDIMRLLFILIGYFLSFCVFSADYNNTLDDLRYMDKEELMEEICSAYEASRLDDYMKMESLKLQLEFLKIGSIASSREMEMQASAYQKRVNNWDTYITRALRVMKKEHNKELHSFGLGGVCGGEDNSSLTVGVTKERWKKLIFPPFFGSDIRKAEILTEKSTEIFSSTSPNNPEDYIDILAAYTMSKYLVNNYGNTNDAALSGTISVLKGLISPFSSFFDSIGVTRDAIDNSMRSLSGFIDSHNYGELGQF